MGRSERFVQKENHLAGRQKVKCPTPPERQRNKTGA